MSARYGVADRIEDIAPMQGIKIAFSDMGNIYDRIRERLGAGRCVVFVGLPCHVQAVKNTFGDDDNLWTVDIACTGQPSPIVLKRYVEELSAQVRVAGLTFRPRGQPSDTLDIHFEDGSSRQSGKDPYMRAYNANLMVNQACAECKFVRTSRTGDISIGSITDKKLDNGAGTSIVRASREIRKCFMVRDRVCGVLCLRAGRRRP